MLNLKGIKHLNLLNNLENECDFEGDEIDPDNSTISRLCGDLTEEVMDDNNADLDGVLVCAHQGGKKHKEM